MGENGDDDEAADEADDLRPLLEQRSAGQSLPMSAVGLGERIEAGARRSVGHIQRPRLVRPGPMTPGAHPR